MSGGGGWEVGLGRWASGQCPCQHPGFSCCPLEPMLPLGLTGLGVGWQGSSCLGAASGPGLDCHQPLNLSESQFPHPQRGLIPGPARQVTTRMEWVPPRQMLTFNAQNRSVFSDLPPLLPGQGELSASLRMVPERCRGTACPPWCPGTALSLAGMVRWQGCRGEGLLQTWVQEGCFKKEPSASGCFLPC